MQFFVYGKTSLHIASVGEVTPGYFFSIVEVTLSTHYTNDISMQVDKLSDHFEISFAHSIKSLVPQINFVSFKRLVV